MSGYSEQSQKLARTLAEKAAKNLRKSGRTVTRNASTGQYTVSEKRESTIIRKGETTIIRKDGSSGSSYSTKY